MRFWVKLHKKCPFFEDSERCPEILNYTLYVSKSIFDAIQETPYKMSDFYHKKMKQLFLPLLTCDWLGLFSNSLL